MSGLTNYLRVNALKEASSNFSRTWVAVERDQKRVLAYATMMVSTVDLDDVDREISRKLPKYAMPVVHLAKFATDKEYEGRGIGTQLFADVCRVTASAATGIGIFALELFAYDQAAHDWYLRRGCLPLQQDTLHLYIPAGTLMDLIAAS